MKILFKIFFSAILFINKLSEAKPQNRIYNGWQVPGEEFPSVVSILIKYRDARGHCSGVLLDEQIVLTAGHCGHRTKEKNISVYAGDFNSVYHAMLSFKFDVKKILRHENADLALFMLDRKVPKKKFFVKFANLPNYEITKPGDTVHVVGYGLPSLKLHATEGRVISNEECYDLWKDLRKDNEILTGKNFCTRPKSKSMTCQGDSGGPAYFIDESDKQWVVGIHSYGANRDCDTLTTIPSVMTRVSHFYKWIEDNRKIIKGENPEEKQNIDEDLGNEFSSHVRIHIKYSNGNSNNCSGVLLDEIVVLTAAQCINVEYTTITVYAGEYDSRFLTISKYSRSVTRIIKHENNLVLLLLNSPLQISVYINYATLAKFEMTEPGVTIKIVGWSKSDYRMEATDHTIMTNKECYQKFSQEGPAVENKFCTKRNKEIKARCDRGVGGPAYLVDNCGQKWVVGIHSHGSDIPCDSAMNPSVMMRVSHYYKWIEKNRKEIKGFYRN